MGELARPWEILQLRDRQSIAIRPQRFERGTVTITDRRSHQLKVVPALRVYVAQEAKPSGPAYHDTYSQRLIAALVPLLEDPVAWTRTIKITAHGVPPMKRFTVERSSA